LPDVQRPVVITHESWSQKEVDESGMEEWSTGQNVPSGDRIPGEIRHLGTCLLGDERTSGHVPGLKIALEIGIQSATGHVAQIEGSCADTPDVTKVHRSIDQHVPLLSADCGIVCKSGSDERK
jgi:hypothetical protein